MSHNLFAVWVIRGCSLSGVIPVPGISATNSCIPPIPNIGKIATDKTMIPIPPIQCVILLQKSNPLGTDSISTRIEAPVVVNPEMVSKKAFVKLGMALLII